MGIDWDIVLVFGLVVAAIVVGFVAVGVVLIVRSGRDRTAEETRPEQSPGPSGDRPRG